MSRTSTKSRMQSPTRPQLRSKAARSDAPSAATIAALLARLEARAPRTHCLTNVVAQNFAANLLLAAGAIPSMTIAPDEVAEFTTRADALLVNLGTLDGTLRKSMARAIAAATLRRKPWALDPVLVDRSAPRLRFARAVMASRPTIVRANGSEFAALAGRKADEDTIAAFARKYKCVVAVTGEVDLVSDGDRNARLANGHALMGRVTAVGCATTALIAAFAAVEPDAFVAAVAALSAINIAGEIAAEHAAGPGSFAVALLDAVYALDGSAIAQRLRIDP